MRSLADQGRFIELAVRLAADLAALEAGHPYRAGLAEAGDAAPLLEELGACYWRLARFPEADTTLRRARKLREARGDGEPSLAPVLERQAALAHYLGDPQAEPLFHRAIAAHEAAHGADNLEVAVARRNFGAYLRDEGSEVAARAELEHAVDRLEQLAGTWHGGYAAALKALATLDFFSGESGAAVAKAEAALKVCLRA